MEGFGQRCIAKLRALAFVLCALAAPARLRAQWPTADAPAAKWDTGKGNGALASVVDTNPDPRILEFALEARVASVEFAPGETIDAYTYNGVLPGPLVRARVGDRLIAHFTNHLPQSTTVHWHGVRVPIQMDGVPGISQDEVKPGESFTYDFTLTDAGLYWYHPHVMSAAQVGFGLYGAILVDDPDDGVLKPDGSKFRERVLVISDIGIEAPGKFEDPESGGSGGMAFGRDGNRLLINGQVVPTFPARAGETERWRIVNTAKSRYYELDLRGEQTGVGRFTLIGVDGGLQEYPTKHDTLVLAPGERADVLVRPPGRPGETLMARALLFNRGYGSVEARLPFEDYFNIQFSSEPELAPVFTDGKLPDVKRDIKPIAAAGATPIKLDLVIAQHPDKSFEYGINGVPFMKDQDIPARTGQTQIWTLNNKTKWSHPFHLHGFFFQQLDENEKPVHPLAWKDTINVPFEKSLKFIVKFEDRPGMWMTHCHILDHAEGGLMGMVQLMPSQ